jgi:hypothetical protein
MTAALLAGLTFILGIGTNWWTTRRALVMQYDADLRRDRLQAYVKLWAELKPLNKYGSDPPHLSRDAVETMADALTKWYFEVGGIYLSVPARQDYFALQDALQQILAAGPSADIGEPAREFVRLKASRLRTGITRDVGTRKSLKLRGDPSPPPDKHLLGTFDGGNGREITITRPWHRLGRGVKVSGLEDPEWDGDAWAIRANPDGEPRQFLLDERGLVEGPVGWEPDEPQVPPAVWERR